MSAQEANRYLPRNLGLIAAVLLGLGSIVGTGVYVSLGLAAGAAGPSVLLAIPLAAGLALCNGLSSAQLAASHPVSGGTYEYGHHYLHPAAGFAAGWLFLCAKSASAAAAAVGAGGYLAALLGMEHAVASAYLPVLTIAGLTLVVLAGLRPSAWVNAVLVSTAVAALIVFVFVAISIGNSGETAAEHFAPFFNASDGRGPISGLFYAVALLFVAYTGYGRVATLGEEVKDPRRTIPRAIGVTLLVALLLYLSVAFAAIAAVGADGFAAAVADSGSPLLAIAAEIDTQRARPWAQSVIALGGVAALTGVLLNLLLGLSRVYLAMARRGDLSPALARLSTRGTTPVLAVLVAGGVAGALAWAGDIETAWSFSAFTVLLYYALTNLCALQMPPEQRMFPRWIAWLGLTGCLGLAVWVPWETWALGCGMIAAGFVLRAAGRRLWL